MWLPLLAVRDDCSHPVYLTVCLYFWPGLCHLVGFPLSFANGFQAIELASHGYMVIALEHPGTAFLIMFDEDNYTELPLAPDIKEQHCLINEQTLRFLQEYL